MGIKTRNSECQWTISISALLYLEDTRDVDDYVSPLPQFIKMCPPTESQFQRMDYLPLERERERGEEGRKERGREREREREREMRERERERERERGLSATGERKQEKESVDYLPQEREIKRERIGSTFGKLFTE